MKPDKDVATQLITSYGARKLLCISERNVTSRTKG